MVKEKPDSIRTYDEDGFRRRAACVCVKDDTEQEILLVSSSHDPGRWVVPGGGVEPKEDLNDAAVREAYEEAGVKGHIVRCLGDFENQDKRTRTSVFVLRVSETSDVWDEAQKIGRCRQWFKFAEAVEQLSLHKPVQVTYLEKLHKDARSKVT